MDIHQKNYRKLLQLIPTLHEIKSAATLTAPGTKNLSIDILHRHHKTSIIAISQYSEHPAGHMVADPYMTIAVYSEIQTIEALTFQNYLGQRQTYIDEIMLFDLEVQAQMNQFLGHWLTSLLAEGRTISV
jgi:uncharacterized protein YqiB (DUF1249 family)